MSWTGRYRRGARAERREEKRREAEERNARTPGVKTKAHRLGRCGCQEEEK